MSQSKELKLKATKSIMKVTNRKQFDRLVDLMKKYPDIARGSVKSGKDFKIELKSHWEYISNELNSIGPPKRNSSGWIKVWTDLKFKIRQKLKKNQVEINATGGGPNKLFILSPLEEAVADLLNINYSVNPPGKEFGNHEPNIIDLSLNELSTDNLNASGNFTRNDISNASVDVYDVEVDEVDFNENLPLLNISTSQNTSTTSRRANNQNNNIRSVTSDIASQRFNLLKDQTNIQKNLFNTVDGSLSEINRCLTESLNYTKKTYYIQKDQYKIKKRMAAIKEEKFKLYKAELIHKQNHRLEKLKLKQKILEISKLQLEIQKNG